MADFESLILASKSSVRTRILTAAGIAHGVVPSHVDEGAIKKDFSDTPNTLAYALALAKAKAVSVRIMASPSKAPPYILGCDQLLIFEGRVYDKVATMQDARARLLTLRGHTHALYGALVLLHENQVIWQHKSYCTLEMRNFSEAFLDHYLAQAGEDILTSVGCYQLEGLGAQLFSSLEGDAFAIMGLPLLPLLDILRARNIIPA